VSTIYVGWVAVAVTAFAVTYLLTPLSARLCWRLGLIDYPRKGELQVRPVARAGGYAIVVGFAVALAVGLLIVPIDAPARQRLLGFLAGLLLVLPLALIDDLKRLPPLPQALGQLAIALVPLLFGIAIDSIASPFGGLIELPALLVIPLTLFWIVGMINTINFVDTMDGVAAGVAVVAAIVLFARAATLEQYSVAVMPLALAAAAAGFLPHNFSPARVFMGSGGSVFLGYTIAVLAIIGGAKIATALMVLGLPILDVAIVIARRLIAGRSPFQGGDGAHLMHRLHRHGMSTQRIAVLLYVFSAAAGATSLLLPGHVKLYLFVSVGALLIIVLGYLAYQGRLARQRGARTTP